MQLAANFGHTADCKNAGCSLYALAERSGAREPELPEEPLYAARKKIYPQRVSGTFRRAKWIILFITLGIYYLLPFVRWDRGPNAPSQAVLVDFPGRRF